MTLAEIIATRGLSAGPHADQDGPCCAVEAQAFARGMLITDDPRKIGVLDVTPLNDSLAWRDDAHRTEHLGPVVLAIDDWVEWSVARQVRFAKLVADGTVERVLPIANRIALGAHGDLGAAAWAAEATKTARAAEMWEASARSGVALPGGGQAMYQEMIETAPTAAARDAARAAAAATAAASATQAAWAAVADAARAAAVVDSAEAIVTACDVWLRAAEESK